MAQTQQPPYPRGLIRDEGDWICYQMANDPHKKEEGTAMLWTNILIRQFPITSGYRFCPEKNPTTTSNLRADGSIYRVGLGSLKAVAFAEWKRASRDTPTGRKEAEEQVRLYCVEYLRANPNQTHVYGITCASTRARVFRVDRGAVELQRLNQAWDGDYFYVDAIHDGLNLLPQAFDELRSFHP
ncbi:hypothetical protein FQN54_004489 [Arachnomyces sp. PD_36]|nr:hypothetical protein FQN54_004489 [Arachnomyces sp. PD_36]